MRKKILISPALEVATATAAAARHIFSQKYVPQICSAPSAPPPPLCTCPVNLRQNAALKHHLGLQQTTLPRTYESGVCSIRVQKIKILLDTWGGRTFNKNATRGVALRQKHTCWGSSGHTNLRRNFGEKAQFCTRMLKNFVQHWAQSNACPKTCQGVRKYPQKGEGHWIASYLT